MRGESEEILDNQDANFKSSDLGKRICGYVEAQYEVTTVLFITL